MVHFHLSLFRCGMGSLETCTHIISRPKTYYSFSLLKLVTIIIIHLDLGRCCKGLQTAHQAPSRVMLPTVQNNNVLISNIKHTKSSKFQQLVGSFVWMKETMTMRIKMRWGNVKHKMFPLVSVQAWHGKPGNMHPYFCCLIIMP